MITVDDTDQIPRVNDLINNLGKAAHISHIGFDQRILSGANETQ